MGSSGVKKAGISSPVGDKRGSKKSADFDNAGPGSPQRPKDDVEGSIGQLMSTQAPASAAPGGANSPNGAALQSMSPDDLDGLAARMEHALALVRTTQKEAAEQAAQNPGGAPVNSGAAGTWQEEKARMEAELRALRAQVAQGGGAGDVNGAAAST